MSIYRWIAAGFIVGTFTVFVVSLYQITKAERRKAEDDWYDILHRDQRK